MALPSDSRAKGPRILLAGRDESSVITEVKVEPVEVQVPTSAEPTEARHIAIAVGDAPLRTRKNQKEFAELGGNHVLVLEQPLGIFLAGVGIEPDGAGGHHFAVDAVFAVV